MLSRLNLNIKDVRSQIEETYVFRESLKASEAFVLKSIEDLRGDKTLEILSSENNVEVETYKGLKRDSSLLPVRAVNEIFLYLGRKLEMCLAQQYLRMVIA